MEKLVLNLHSKNQILQYRDENRLMRYEQELIGEMLRAIAQNDNTGIIWFSQFGDTFRTILMNVHAYRSGLAFGYEDIAFDKYGWFQRPEFQEKEDLIFGNSARYGEYSVLHIGKGKVNIWTYSLNYNFGTAGGGSALSVYGKKFNTREAAINAGLSELKSLMADKLNNSDTTNYKQPVILCTLRDIAAKELAMVQLSLF